MNLEEFAKDIADEVETILSSDFDIDVTETKSVPHSDDPAITFPNLDDETQGVKLLNTTVLYVDMRRSTELSLRHRKHTVAKLYSAFVRAMTRCASWYGGEVRGIIGDRVMILFESKNCFGAAVDTAELMLSVCHYIINKHFRNGNVEFGFGIDYGAMLVTKTGIRKHGSAQQSYRSLVWLGRPANIASKLTDRANKPAEIASITKVRVYYNYGWLKHADEYPWDFVRKFKRDPVSGLMIHDNLAFSHFETIQETEELHEATPPILMTKAVYDGFKKERPDAAEIKNKWFSLRKVQIAGYAGPIYGGNVIMTAIRDLP